MLPYTPMHHLLLRATGGMLVMTSGNVSEEPIAKDNDEAVQRLGGIADRFLLHDRDIYARYDDSVVRVVDGTTADDPARPRILPACRCVWQSSDVDKCWRWARISRTRSACSMTATRSPGRTSVISTARGRSATTTRRCARTCGFSAQRLRPSRRTCIPTTHRHGSRNGGGSPGAREVRVQHHHAHIASVLAEHGLRGTVLGVAFDGVGLGPDQRHLGR